MKTGARFIIWIGLCMSLFLVACEGNPTLMPPTEIEELTNEEQQTINAEPSIDELTFEQQLALTPPSPRNLKVNPEGNGVQIYWEAAEIVKIPHGYSDVVLYYKVFRRAEGTQEVVLLGTSRELSFLDANRTAADNYYYSVVAVHKGLDGGEIDGSRSEEVYGGN